MRSHEVATFATLTFDQDHVPDSLDRADFSAFAKRLRKALGPFRFFGSGEYGEQTGRPHFHALLFGVPESERASVNRAWGQGLITLDPITPARVAYVAGYTQKKVSNGARPFRIMSRRPGIGSLAGRRFSSSWRSFAVTNGRQHGVPRYLHDTWLETASAADLEDLEFERSQRQLALARDLSYERLEIEAEVAEAAHRQRSSRRRLDSSS